MKVAKSLLVVVALAATGLGVAYVARGRAESPVKPEADPALRREIAELRNAVRQSQALAVMAAQAKPRAERRHEADSDREKMGAHDTSETEASNAEAEPKIVESEVEPRERLERKFHEEAPDHSWSSKAAEEAKAGLERGLPEGSQIVSVECRASICRSESSHSNFDRFREFIDRTVLTPEFKWEGPAMWSVLEQSERGHVSGVLYLLRPGETWESVLGAPPE